jgi:hypothetical protein
LTFIPAARESTDYASNEYDLVDVYADDLLR